MAQNEQTSSEALDRARLVRAGTLHGIHWVIVASSLLVTVGAWYFTKSQIDEKVKARFERGAKQIVELVTERMQRYEDGLWGGVGAIHANGGDIGLDAWIRFAETLKIGVKYPGINGIGVIHRVGPERVADYVAQQRKQRPDFTIHPPHDANEFLPIAYIEPFSLNYKALGLDMAHETNRYTAVKRARDTGTAQITGPIVLVQDADRTPGFLFFAPWYREAAARAVDQEAPEFAGLVYAPFVVDRLMRGTLHKEKRSVGVRISDGDEVIYDELSEAEPDFDPEPIFASVVDLPIYGRVWHFDIQTGKSFKQAAENTQPLTILVCGLTIDAMLLLLFVSMAKANRDTLRYADMATHELSVRAEAERALEARAHALAQSNQELDEFAYVASHDLKSPLRGIDQLASFIAEDAADQLPARSREDLELLRGRVKRMHNLLEGLLQYSRIGQKEGQPEYVDCAEVVEDVVQLCVPEDRFEVEIQGDPPTVFAPRAAVHLVIRNIIANAVKHHDRERGRLEISWDADAETTTIVIRDDGPGIPYEHRDRVFGLFQTLQSRDQMESSGIGLAIAKKTVLRHGGSIELVEGSGRGTSFCVKWPRRGEKPENTA